MADIIPRPYHPSLYPMLTTQSKLKVRRPGKRVHHSISYFTTSNSQKSLSLETCVLVGYASQEALQCSHVTFSFFIYADHSISICMQMDLHTGRGVNVFECAIQRQIVAYETD